MKTLTFNEAKYKLVPVTPTADMDKAAQRCTTQSSYGEAMDAWDAMVLEAPEYPSGAVVG